MIAPGKPAMVPKDTTESDKSDTQGKERKQHDERQESAKYRRKVDELNRSRDIDIDRAFMLRGGR
jgi:hypothetical protein